MKSDFASIPTEYRGIRFRSRLEARWAVFFDLLGWEWEYEPVDLQGWIPDFKILGNNDLYVEVKYFPVYSSFPEIDERWAKQMKKISKSTSDLPVLLLSNTPVDNESNLISGCVGIIFDKYEDEWFWDGNGTEPNLQELTLAWASTPFLTEDYPSRHKPHYSVKGETNVSFENMSKERITEYWNNAGNETQWKKPNKL